MAYEAELVFPLSGANSFRFRPGLQKRRCILSDPDDDIDVLLGESGLTSELSFVLRMTQLAAFEDLTTRLRETNLTLSQLALLRLINARQGLRQQQISDALRVKKTNLVTTIDRLEALGLVERRPSPTDKRAHALHLTSQGVKTLSRAMGVVDEHLQRVHSFLTPAEHKRLLALLGKLRAGFDLC